MQLIVLFLYPTICFLLLLTIHTAFPISPELSAIFLQRNVCLPKVILIFCSIAYFSNIFHIFFCIFSTSPLVLFVSLLVWYFVTCLHWPQQIAEFPQSCFPQNSPQKMIEGFLTKITDCDINPWNEGCR